MQPKKIAFRVDASEAIGSGHFMRCLTLAIELRKQGYEVSFICRHLPESYAVYLSNNKIDLYRLEQRPKLKNLTEAFYLNWLGTTQENDANDTTKAIKHMDWDWIVVDHYALDISWESLIKPYAKKLMVIDDISHQHACDLLLDQNYYHQASNPYQDLVPKDCKVLLGPKYALLRPEFQSAREAVNRKTNVIHRLLIFFGGMDADDMTSQAIEAISGLKDLIFVVDVVIGNQHPNKENIIRNCQRLNYHCHVQTNKMAELIAQADLCIGAGGSATWERCALGLPSITFAIAENQQELTKNAARACLIYAPTPSNNLVETIRLHFMALYNNPLLRDYISRTSMQLVDAKGALRVLKELEL